MHFSVLLRLLQHSTSSLLSTAMLFRCGTCTYIVDSDIHGKGPCPMCNELRPRRLALERGDPGYEAPGGVVGKVVEAGELGGEVSGFAKRSGLEAELRDVSGCKKGRQLDSVLDVVEARGFALDPNLIRQITM